MLEVCSTQDGILIVYRTPGAQGQMPCLVQIRSSFPDCLGYLIDLLATAYIQLQYRLSPVECCSSVSSGKIHSCRREDIHGELDRMAKNVVDG